MRGRGGRARAWGAGGPRTAAGAGFIVREVVRVPWAVVVGLARLVFFSTGRVSCSCSGSFSLSKAICISGLICFLPRVGAGCGFCRAGEGSLFVACSCGRAGRGFGAGTCTDIFCFAGDDLEKCCFGGDALAVCCFGFVDWCCAMSSRMVNLRMEIGMRLTRRSIRARRSAHWRAYPARSWRARSVTGKWLAMLLHLRV